MALRALVTDASCAPSSSATVYQRLSSSTGMVDPLSIALKLFITQGGDNPGSSSFQTLPGGQPLSSLIPGMSDRDLTRIRDRSLVMARHMAPDVGEDTLAMNMNAFLVSFSGDHVASSPQNSIHHDVFGGLESSLDNLEFSSNQLDQDSYSSLQSDVNIYAPELPMNHPLRSMDDDLNFSDEAAAEMWMREFDGTPGAGNGAAEWVQTYERVFRENNLASINPLIPNFSEEHYRFQSDNIYLHTNNGQSLFESGLLAFKSGDLGDAILRLEAEVQHQPQHSMAWRILGTAHAESDNDKAAIAALHRAVNADPTNLQALLDLGVSYTNELDQSRALSFLRQWIESNPKYCDIAQDPSAYADAADSHQEVLNMFLIAANRNIEDSSVFSVLGVLYNLSREYDKAIDAFRKSLQIDPTNYSLWNKIGATQANGQKSKEAVDAYRQALRLKPTYGRAWANLGISFSNMGDYRGSLPFFLRSLQLNPAADHLWNYVRMAFSCIDRSDLAAKTLDMNLNDFTDFLQIDFDLS